MAPLALDLRSQADAFRERASHEFAMSKKDLGGGPARRHARYMEETLRLAIPRRGHVLSTAAEHYGYPIREAIAALSVSLARKPHADIARCLHSLRGPNDATEIYRSDADMAARLIAAMWITGVAVKAIPVSASFAEAERWFFGGDPADSLAVLPSGNAIAAAEKSLRGLADASAYRQLLPYILDPHGPGSRLSVKRDPKTRTARSHKRAEGVFYTPADVAEYMVDACLDALDGDLPSPLFDPACGTGVFLRAALRELRRRYPTKDALALALGCLFGADIDPWAPDATAFVLLNDISTDPAGSSLPPIASWQRMRRNLACIDTLLIDPTEQVPSDIKGRRNDGGRVPISQLFPALKGGPAVILGNPPYANLGARSDLTVIGATFRTIAVKQQPSAEIYFAFVEQMIRLAAPEACAGALVLPLSIACNVGPQFVTARKMIAEARGRWRFAFFDREPHALFGEDVKTRNAIVLWARARRDEDTVLATGPLRKWRGDSRAMMFKSLNFTTIGGDIHGGIPKIDGARQAAALEALAARWTRLERAVQCISRRTLAAAPNADEQTVFVGPTAYNFINVFLKPPRALLPRYLPLSEHPLHAIACASRQDALAIFAVLSSRLAYWWWHAQGDGFHVSSRFLSEFPFGIDALSGPCGEILSRYGAELWSTIQSSPIVSLNRGRASLAFTPNEHDKIRRKIDQVLADLAGLRDAFVDELRQFTAHTVAATLRVHANSGTDEQEGI